MKTEEIKPLLDRLNPPHKFFRINTGNGRLYYRQDEDGTIHTYVSATTWVRSVLPTPQHLITWIRQQGTEYEKVLELSANYGTTLHMLCAQFMIDGEFDLSRVDKIIEPFAAQENFKYWSNDWADDLKSDMIAFAQFVHDVDFEPLGIEMVLASEKLGVAGALDYIGYMNIEVDGFSDTEVFKSGERKGQPKPEKKKKRVLAIVDVKSGRKGFHQDHELQLTIHREAFLETFPQFIGQDLRLFNFSPKDWKTVPSYNLKDQTQEFNMDLLPHLKEVARIQEMRKDRTIKRYDGKITTKAHDLTQCFQFTTLTDYLKTKNDA